MEIYGPGQIHGPQSITAPHHLQAPQVDTSLDTTPLDQVDISAEADLVSRVHELPDIRADRVEDIRAEIDAGVYETDEKLDVAVSRLLDEIG